MLSNFILRSSGQCCALKLFLFRIQVFRFHSRLPQRKKLKRHSESASSGRRTTHRFVLADPTLSLLETRCKSMGHLRQIQSQMCVSGLSSDGLAYSRLVVFSALSPAGDIDYAKRLLRAMRNGNAFSWNIVIRASSEDPNPVEVFDLYKKMLADDFDGGGVRPDKYTFPLLFKACAKLGVLNLGYGVLCHVVKMCYDCDLFVRNALIHFMVCCGELGDARKVFDESPVRDLVSWNTLISGYVRCGRGEEALQIFTEMEGEIGVDPDGVTMIGVVTACAQLGDLWRAHEFYRYARDKGLVKGIPLVNALVDMYVKCGDLDAARALFEGMEERTVVSWTTMVVGYAKFGYLDAARAIFDAMPDKDVIPWNAMLGGYAHAQCGKEALSLFQEMQAAGVEPDEVTMVNCLSACVQLGALDVGIWIHRYIEKHGLTVNVALGTSLVDMYAKCGNIAKALQVFREIPGKNALTYTAIIGSLALHADAHDALYFFWEMIDAGLRPDEITILGVLSACCHGGLVKEGWMIFSRMSSEFNVQPKIKHYSCMVDLLGRAGLLSEAMELITSMPMHADAVVWGAMFFACRMHKNIELGERAAARLLELDPGDSGTYVLLASMYMEANMWHEADKVRKMMRERGVDKTPGCSSIEVDGKIIEFLVRDKSDSYCKQIQECLMLLYKHMKDEFLSDLGVRNWTI